MQEVPKVGKVVHASAISVSGSEVHLDNGASVTFDYLVLASSSTWDDPVCSGTEASLTDRKSNQQARAAVADDTCVRLVTHAHPPVGGNAEQLLYLHCSQQCADQCSCHGMKSNARS